MANQLSSFQTLIQSIETFINDIGTFINDSDSNEPMSRDKITDCLQQLQTKCVEIRQQYIPIDNLIYLSSQASSSSTKPSQAAQDKKRLTGKESKVKNFCSSEAVRFVPRQLRNMNECRMSCRICMINRNPKKNITNQNIKVEFQMVYKPTEN
eukprot:725267_1